MQICYNCNQNHNGEYGSGRFCSQKCARSYSTKNKRTEINKKVSKKLKGRERVGVKPTEETIQKVKNTWLQKLLEQDFNSLSFGSKRKVVLHEQNNKCNKCNISEWYGKPIILEIDHINGISDDDRRENLEALCPNCHSITDTWRGRNKPSKNGKNKVTDEELLCALKESKNIRQALLSVGLAAKGGNYERARHLRERGEKESHRTFNP